MRNQVYIRPYDTPNGIEKLSNAIKEAEAVIIGAGAGLSTSAGFVYDGERFERYFKDFSEKYHFNDMYSGGFYPYETPEEKWAFWSRFVYINRYMKIPKPVYEKLLDLVKDKDYFVITTNVDHCFQKTGFDKQRVFYTQGDYGLFQCSKPCHNKTYDNEDTIRKMVLSQGYAIAKDGILVENGPIQTRVPSELIPFCPVCGEPMAMNLRADDTFVQDEGCEVAAGRYSDYLQAHRNKKVLFLDAGTGFNTPIIFKIPFWQWTEEWPDAKYACLNYGEAFAPEEIKDKSICINGDIGDILDQLL